MHCSLLKLNPALLFWKLLLFEVLLSILETSLGSVSARVVNNFLLVDALLMSFQGR
jgi:hypothetical protein